MRHATLTDTICAWVSNFADRFSVVADPSAFDVRQPEMNPYDSEELAERIDELFHISVKYGHAVPAVEPRNGRYMLYALEVFRTEDEFEPDGVSSLQISGTEVLLPDEDLVAVLRAARVRLPSRDPGTFLREQALRPNSPPRPQHEWAVVGERRWYGESDYEPVFVWIDWDADEAMHALHVGTTAHARVTDTEPARVRSGVKQELSNCRTR